MNNGGTTAPRTIPKVPTKVAIPPASLLSLSERNLSGKIEVKFTRKIEPNVSYKHVVITSHAKRIQAPSLGSTSGGVKRRR